MDNVYENVFYKCIASLNRLLPWLLLFVIALSIILDKSIQDEWFWKSIDMVDFVGLLHFLFRRHPVQNH